jgi:hypothetical protein
MELVVVVLVDINIEQQSVVYTQQVHADRQFFYE